MKLLLNAVKNQPKVNKLNETTPFSSQRGSLQQLFLSRVSAANTKVERSMATCLVVWVYRLHAALRPLIKAVHTSAARTGIFPS